MVGTTGMSKTPRFVCEMAKLQENLKVLENIQKRADVDILLALKGFALKETFSLMRRYLSGTSASSLNEARVAKDFNKEIHTYLPAYAEDEILEIAAISDTLIFNSLSQFDRFYSQVKERASCGLRINLELDFNLPEHCNANAKGSRLGVVASSLHVIPKEVEGLHVHALCSQNADAFFTLISELEDRYSQHFKQLKWINFGGGHALTCKEYDVEYLIKILKDFKQKYPHLRLYLEPSEAVVHEAGYLEAKVLDIVHNEIDIAILDASIEVHLTDIMLTKQPPKVRGSVKDGRYTYQLAGCSCAAGDIFGTYSFEKPLKVSDKIIFENKLAYTIVKTTTFNGINPANLVLKG